MERRFRRWAMALATLGLILVSLMATVSAHWLYQQPAYQIRFEDIELDPPCPAWIKPGRKGLLKHVRAEAGRPPVLALPEIDLKALRDDFQRTSPWIRSVPRLVKRGPNRLIVTAEFREPVAACSWPGRIPLILDRDGVVLPEDELDHAACGFLIELQDLAPEGATAAQFTALSGRVLRIAPRQDVEPEPRPAQAAARLAGYLRGRSLDDAARKPSCTVDALYLTKDGFFARTPEKAMIYWKDAPGDEVPGEASADEKWTMLRQWVDRGNDLKDVVWPRYLAFERGRALVVVPKTQSSRKDP
jgi:hypothetical protein